MCLIKNLEHIIDIKEKISRSENEYSNVWSRPGSDEDLLFEDCCNGCPRKVSYLKKTIADTL